MKQPLWIINSALLGLLAIVFMVVFFTWQQVPERSAITSDIVPTTVVSSRPEINVQLILEYDLFDTFSSKPPTQQPEESITPPPLPAVQATSVPPLPKPSFLQPLNVTLKGVVTVTYDDAKNRAIIADNKTDQEAVYRVGDMIEDAQLVRIFTHKVILVRSNGQQEVLYLRESDAKKDPMYISVGDWQEVVKEDKTNSYIVDPVLFANRVKSLAQFIDMLDLTTVYRRGKSVGCRIGNVENDSFGVAIGLRIGDIVTRVNQTPITDVSNRFTVYKAVVQTPQGQPIVIDIQRGMQPMQISVTLEEKKKVVQKQDEGLAKIEVVSPAMIKQKEEKVLQEKLKLAPSVREIRDRERKTMQERGKRVKPSLAE